MQSAVPVPDGTNDPPLAKLIPFPHQGPVVAIDAEPEPEPVLEPRPVEPDVTVRWTDLGTPLYGGVVTDPEQIAAIRRRVQAGVAKEARRRAWRRRLLLIRAGR